MDPTLFSQITTLLALGVSIITALGSVILKYVVELKMYDRKFITEHKVKAIEDYLDKTGRFLFFETQTNDGVADGLSTIYIYAPKELWPQIDKMNEYILKIKNVSDYSENSHLRREARGAYVELCKAFSQITTAKNWQRKLLR